MFLKAQSDFESEVLGHLFSTLNFNRAITRAWKNLRPCTAEVTTEMSRMLARVLKEFPPVYPLLLSAFVSHQCPCFQWVTIKSTSVTAEVEIGNDTGDSHQKPQRHLIRVQEWCGPKQQLIALIVARNCGNCDALH
jgi:hypothetical protein